MSECLRVKCDKTAEHYVDVAPMHQSFHLCKMCTVALLTLIREFVIGYEDPRQRFVIERGCSGVVMDWLTGRSDKQAQS